MLFGIYLVENGVLSCEDFYEALKLQLRTRPQLGALAIELRILSARQVFNVLRSQSDAPGDMFGEAAVAMGYLTRAQLGQLMHEQAVRTRPMSEFLVAAGLLSVDAAAMHLREYRKTMENVEKPDVSAVNG